VGKFSDPDIYKVWDSDDLVFNYCVSTGENVRQSNVLQVIVNPYSGDDTDISHETLFDKNRSGLIWMIRKGRLFHDQIRYIHNQSDVKAIRKEGRAEAYWDKEQEISLISTDD